jgi:hypothetical protein
MVFLAGNRLCIVKGIHSMATTRRPRCVKAAVALIAFVLALTSATVVLAAPSSARAAAPQKGKGFTIQGGHDFVGFYVSGSGRKLYCLSPNKALPTTVSLRRIGHYSGVSTTQSEQLAYALGRWGNAGTARAAAAESQVLNLIVGNKADVARRAKLLPKQVATTVRAHLVDVHRYYGEYVTTVRTPRALLPGQQFVGTVTITSVATGHRLPHIPVTLTSSPNVAVPGHTITNSKGVGKFTYRVTDVGEVHIAASAKKLPSRRILANPPTQLYQHMVSPLPLTHTRGSASFRKSPSGFAHKYACTTTCNGRPKTTVSACAPASGRASRIVFHYGTKTAIIRFGPSTSKVCKSTAFITRDGQRVFARWQFKTKNGWSKPVVAHGAFVVDCPAVPPVGVTLTYNCTKASLTIGLANLGPNGTWTPLVNTSKHRMVLVIGGAKQLRILARHGKSAVFTTTASCDSPTTYTMQAGVQRANGQYNYGPRGSVTTPGPAS